MQRTTTSTRFTPNENKMSDGGRDRASLGVVVRKSSRKGSAQRSAVRSIAKLDALFRSIVDLDVTTFIHSDRLRGLNARRKGQTNPELNPPAAVFGVFCPYR